MSKYALIDKETGEILEPDVLLIGRKPYKVDKGFVKVFVSFLRDVVENPKIAGKAIRLLFYLIEECLDYNTLTVRIIPKYAVNALKISDRTYRNWIKTLIDSGILVKIDTYTYKLTPYTVVKGSMNETLKSEIDKIAKTSKDKKDKESEENENYEYDL